MAKANVTIKVKFPWWGVYYIRACVMFGRFFNMQPNRDKIINTILRHSKVRK